MKKFQKKLKIRMMMKDQIVMDLLLKALLAPMAPRNQMILSQLPPLSLMMKMKMKWKQMKVKRRT